MTEALLLFEQPALPGRKKIKFKGKSNVFGAASYFKHADLLLALNNPFAHMTGTFLLSRELRHFNVQLALGA